MKQQGFTLVEILTAVVIVTILVTMAVPLYEKTIERSRMAEARTLLAKLQDAKLQTMDNMGCSTYSTSNANCPKVKHLNISFVSAPGDYSFSTTDFFYSLAPSTYVNAVCARRLGGDYIGTVFLYAAPGVTGVSEPAHFYCSGTNCENYGLPITPGITCN